MTTQSNKNNLFTVTNWNYCQKIKEGKKIILTMSASPEKNLFYSAVMVENEYREISSKDFLTLNQACEYLNNEFLDWEFHDLSQTKKSDSGCGSCVAH